MYEHLGELAKQAVIRTMLEGEVVHGTEKWKQKDIDYHKRHAFEHAEKAYVGAKTSEDDIGHCLTRCAMILWARSNHD